MADQILQAGVGPIRSSTYLPADPERVFWGRLPGAGDEPVLSIDSGTEVTIDTVSHEGIHEDQGRDPIAFFAGFGVDREAVLDDAATLAASDHPHDPKVDGAHVITGPVHVSGAEPGDLLKITVLETLPRVPYGIMSSRHGRGGLPGEYPLTPGTSSLFAAVDGDELAMARREGGERDIRFAMNPFLGIMGVAPAEGGRLHSAPPGLFGGNIDINMLTVGNALYLPVQVAGALAYVGDPHFAQGDGEISLTAVEASLRATLRFDVIPKAQAVEAFGEQVGPLVETTEFLVPTGLDEDLDEAVKKCIRAAVTLLQARFGLDAAHAYAYLGAATDFNISQVVDIVKGVHARVRMSDFA